MRQRDDGHDENSIKKSISAPKSQRYGYLSANRHWNRECCALVASISEACSGQAMGIEQVNTGVVQVSQVVQSNAATARKAPRPATLAQSEQLKETSAFQDR
jgi:methyl-accepting chemotaxis protein